MARFALLAACAVLTGVPITADGESPGIFLAILEVESTPGLAPQAPLLATLELNTSGLSKVASLGEWFPRVRPSNGRVTLVLEGRAPTASSAPAPAHRAESFLVDFGRPEAAAFREELARRKAGSDQDLAEFVNAWIEKKNMTRGIDAASRVAAHREGDCTEHAVLLAAAARLAGRAARVVFGVALVPVEGQLRGVGHAWTEIHDGRVWRTVDATPLPSGVRYLPLAALSDEGPGYLGAVWAGLSPIDIRRIKLEPAPAERH